MRRLHSDDPPAPRVVRARNDAASAGDDAAAADQAGDEAMHVDAADEAAAGTAALPSPAAIVRMTVPELKEQLARLGQPIDGLKAVLAKRLKDYVEAVETTAAIATAAAERESVPAVPPAHSSWGALCGAHNARATGMDLRALLFGEYVDTVRQQVHVKSALTVAAAITVNDLLCRFAASLITESARLSGRCCPKEDDEDSRSLYEEAIQRGGAQLLAYRSMLAPRLDQTSGLRQAEALVSIAPHFLEWVPMETLGVVPGGLELLDAFRQLDTAVCDARVEAFKQVDGANLERWHRAHGRAISEDDVLSAIHNVLNGELVKHAIAEAQKAIEAHKTCRTPLGDFPGGLTPSAQLQFPVELMGELTMHLGNKEVSDYAAVGLAACTEYICAEILELSGYASYDDFSRSGMRCIPSIDSLPV